MLVVVAAFATPRLAAVNVLRCLMSMLLIAFIRAPQSNQFFLGALAFSYLNYNTLEARQSPQVCAARRSGRGNSCRSRQWVREM